ncbi:hypothetical protein LPJ59_001764 [Coemansia sp. RSA 2399]|nr:hypothetical protein LPJ59_001764 [Coemansia sp. RSA 2399]
MSLGSNNRRPRNASNSSSTSSSSTDISFAQYTQPTIVTTGLSAHMFPTIPSSPTDLAVTWCGSPSPSTQQCTSSRINFAGSWLDLGSDSEDEYSTHHSGLLLRSSRRKGSSLSASKDSSSAKNNTFSNLKELTRRSSMHFRKLTNRSGSSS